MIWEIDGRHWPNRDLSRFVRVKGHTWHIQEAGDGPLVLLLHGAGASTHSWRDVIPRLAQDHAVMALDLPGQGFTRVNDKRRCGLNAMAEDIRALLRHQGREPDIVVGHSAGAALALRLALDLERKPAALISINGALKNFPGPAGIVFPAMARLLSMNPLSGFGFSFLAGSTGTVRRLIRSTGSTIDRRGLAGYRLLFSDPDHVDGTLAMMANWHLDRLLEDLRRLDVAAHFLVGGRDRAVPPSTSAAAARRIGGAQLVEVSDAGHLLHEEQPDWIVDRIRDASADAIARTAV
ncbi:MAG: alpha/beta fold hydrolase BchO [Pseudomonadota bacterium]